MIFLLILCALLVSVNAVLVFLNQKKSKEVVEKDTELQEYMKALVDAERAIGMAITYEQFYASTLEDINAALVMLEDLMSKRIAIADDTDVRNLYKTIVLLHDILVGYKKAKEPLDDTDSSRSVPITTT